MTKIIDLKDGKIIIAPECLAIEPFKSIWEKDKNKDKVEATKAIKYIWYYSSFKSPFFQLGDADRHRLIVENILEDKAFKLTPLIKEGIKTFEEIFTTPAMKLFRAAQASIVNMELFFSKTTYNEDNVTKIQKAIIDMPKMQEAVQKALDNCIKEQSTGDRVRGNATLGLFENKN